MRPAMLTRSAAIAEHSDAARFSASLVPTIFSHQEQPREEFGPSARSRPGVGASSHGSAPSAASRPGNLGLLAR